MAVLGKTPADRLKTINQGGLTIRTTLNPTMQKAAQKEITKAVPVGNKQNLGAAATILEPGTGKVLAMAQATDFDQGRRPTSTSTRSTAAASSASSSGRRPRCSRLVDGAREGDAAQRHHQGARSPTGKQGPPVHRQDAARPRSAAPTSRGRSRTTTPAAASTMTLGEGIAKSINTWARPARHQRRRRATCATR